MPKDIALIALIIDREGNVKRGEKVLEHCGKRGVSVNKIFIHERVRGDR